MTEESQNSVQTAPKKTRKRTKLTKMQQMDVLGMILAGLENKEILEQYKKTYYPNNNKFTTYKEKHSFFVQLNYYRNIAHSDAHFKDVIKKSQQGVAKKELRIQTLKNRQSDTQYKIDNETLTHKEYVSLNTLLLKQLRQIGEEVGDLKSGGISVNIDNRQVRFEGQGVATAITPEQMEALQAKQRAIDAPDDD
jgi:predicted RNase H-like nuclease (RuvC/YqgF family)